MGKEANYIINRLRDHGWNKAADRIESQAKRIEELEEERELSRTNGRRLEGTITRLQASNAKLEEEENATIRATAELLGTALQDYASAQISLADRWSSSYRAERDQLLAKLHFCEALGREALEALEAITPNPTSSPRCSDGSGT